MDKRKANRKSASEALTSVEIPRTWNAIRPPVQITAAKLAMLRRISTLTWSVRGVWKNQEGKAKIAIMR